jgi:hypothetical protein
MNAAGGTSPRNCVAWEFAREKAKLGILRELLHEE